MIVACLACAVGVCAQSTNAIAPAPASASLERIEDTTMVQWEHDEMSYVLTSNYVFTVASAITGVPSTSFLIENMSDTLPPAYFYQTNNGVRATYVRLRYQITSIITNIAYNVPFQIAVASQDEQGKIWSYSDWLHFVRQYNISAPGLHVVYSGGVSNILTLTTNDIGTIIIINTR